MTLEQKVIEAIFEKEETYIQCLKHGIVYKGIVEQNPIALIRLKGDIPLELMEYDIRQCSDCFSEVEYICNLERH